MITVTNTATITVTLMITNPIIIRSEMFKQVQLIIIKLPELARISYN